MQAIALSRIRGCPLHSNGHVDVRKVPEAKVKQKSNSLSGAWLLRLIIEPHVSQQVSIVSPFIGSFAVATPVWLVEKARLHWCAFRKIGARE